MREKIETTESNLSKKQDKTKKELLNTFTQTKRFRIKYWDYESYEIQITNDKIEAVKFHYYLNNKKHSFIAYISYKLYTREIKERNFYEENYKDRYTHLNITKISNLKVFRIQKKVKVWYGEAKFSPNYFRYLWINKDSLHEFILALLNKYHSLK